MCSVSDLLTLFFDLLHLAWLSQSNIVMGSLGFGKLEVSLPNYYYIGLCLLAVPPKVTYTLLFKNVGSHLVNEFFESQEVPRGLSCIKPHYSSMPCVEAFIHVFTRTITITADKMQANMDLQT